MLSRFLFIVSLYATTLLAGVAWAEEQDVMENQAGSTLGDTMCKFIPWFNPEYCARETFWFCSSVLAEQEPFSEYCAPSSIPSEPPSSEPTAPPSSEPSMAPSSGPFECPVPEQESSIKCGECRGPVSSTNYLYSDYSYDFDCFNVSKKVCGDYLTSGDCANNATDNCFVSVCGTESTEEDDRGCQKLELIDDSFCGPSRQDVPWDGDGRQLGEGFERFDDDEDEEEDAEEESHLQKDQSFLGFVRIPKTGSTTLLHFLRQAKHMHTWDKHLPGDAAKKRGPNVAGCVYGYATSKRRLAGYYSPKKFWNRCPHLPYSKISAYWENTALSWSPPVGSVQQEPKLDAMTIVREPFDRLVSYFYYLRKFTETNEFLKHTVTDAQYERVKSNDLDGWMELLHTENGGKGLLLPYQYKYVHEDIDQAIALIQQDALPGVFPLVTECYEASLHLVTENFCCFEDNHVNEFMQSDDYMANKNEGSHVVKPDPQSLVDLRAKAEVWFAEDFLFYDAVVEQFLARLGDSNLDKSLLESCALWANKQQTTRQ